MTISLAAVFIPVLFMGGILGRLLHEFAVTIGVAILVSGFVSLTLTPMLCSRFLQAARGEAARARSTAPSERVFDGMLTALRPHAAARAAAPRSSCWWSSLATCWSRPRSCSRSMPKGFIPTEDTGQIFAFTEAAQDVSFEAMVELQQQAAADRRRAIRTSSGFMSSIGVGGAERRRRTPGASSCA